jgi:hypothetical protein
MVLAFGVSLRRRYSASRRLCPILPESRGDGFAQIIFASTLKAALPGHARIGVVDAVAGAGDPAIPEGGACVLLPIVWALAAEIRPIVAQNSAAAAVPNMTRLPEANPQGRHTHDPADFGSWNCLLL